MIMIQSHNMEIQSLTKIAATGLYSFPMGNSHQQEFLQSVFVKWNGQLGTQVRLRE